MLEPGMILFDAYRVIKFVGEGTWANVYEAEHQDLGRSVAIKQLKTEWIEDKNALDRFRREAEIVARLNHPNVVTIYDFKYDQGTHSHFIITEFAEKSTLADRLTKSSKELTIDEVLYIGMGICSGLEAVHRLEVVHQDIKPSNILLVDAGEMWDIPKLSDFGIARAPAFTDGVTLTDSEPVGTLYYMSPEQLDPDRKVDSQSDLYSLGILLYELLTGQVPFTGGIEKVFLAHAWEAPKPPSELRTDIPKALERVILQALRKNRKDRYQSAADMREALRAVKDIPLKRERRRKFRDLLEQGLEHLKKDEWDLTIEILRQADVLEPGNDQVQQGLQKARERQELQKQYELGIWYGKERQWQDAWDRLTEVVNRSPDYANGQAREYLDQAAQELEQERSQRDLMVRYHSGMEYFRKYEWLLAIVDLEYVINQEPKFLNAANRLNQARRYARAERLLERAQRHKEQDEWREVVDCLEDIEQLNPPHINVSEDIQYAKEKSREQQRADWYNIGKSQLEAGNLEQAITYFKRISEQEDEYRDVPTLLKKTEKQLCLDQLSKKAYEYKTDDEWEQSVAVCREILTIDPFSREAVRCLVRVHRRVRWENFCTQFRSRSKLTAIKLLLQESNGARTAAAFVAGAVCTYLVTQLMKQFLPGFPINRYVFSIVFLMLIFVPLFSYLIQWLVVQQHKTSELEDNS